MNTYHQGSSTGKSWPHAKLHVLYLPGPSGGEDDGAEESCDESFR